MAVVSRTCVSCRALDKSEAVSTPISQDSLRAAAESLRMTSVEGIEGVAGVDGASNLAWNSRIWPNNFAPYRWKHVLCDIKLYEIILVLYYIILYYIIFYKTILYDRKRFYILLYYARLD